MISWIVEDWKNNRFRLVCETLGSLCFISIYILMAWHGDDVSILNIFLIKSRKMRYNQYKHVS